MVLEGMTEVYVFESDKERAFRMERRKFYQQNKRVVDEILKIGKDKQVKAGYRGDVYLPKDLHNSLWQDVAIGRELTCVIGLYAMEDGSQLFYNFTGEFDTSSTILVSEEDPENLEGLVKEIKHTLQTDIFYGARCKPWFYTFEQQETLSSAEEVAQAQENFLQNVKDNPLFLDYLTEDEEQKQDLADALRAPLPEAHDFVMRGLRPEERKEFVRIYSGGHQ